MTPPQQAGGLSATAQVVSNVFSSCIMSLNDLEPLEKILVGHKAVQDVISVISNDSSYLDHAARALAETVTLAQSALSRLDPLEQ